MRAKERNEQKRAQTQVRKRAHKSAKGREKSVKERFCVKIANNQEGVFVEKGPFFHGKRPSRAPQIPHGPRPPPPPGPPKRFRGGEEGPGGGGGGVRVEFGERGRALYGEKKAPFR